MKYIITIKINKDLGGPKPPWALTWFYPCPRIPKNFPNHVGTTPHKMDLNNGKFTFPLGPKLTFFPFFIIPQRMIMNIVLPPPSPSLTPNKQIGMEEMKGIPLSLQTHAQLARELTIEAELT